LYDWVLSWADTPWGNVALFVLSFVESSFFPIPPDTLLIALCLGKRRSSWWFALNCTVASVLGGLFGYLIGFAAFEVVAQPILEFYGKTGDFEPLAAQFRDNGAMAVFIAALTPVPYKLVTITAGAVSLNIPVFIAASIIGRGLRFFAVAGLLWWLGEPVRKFIERWFELLTVIFTVLLVGGLVVARYAL
jgi:membrane protein YqaA with SNARE-associated domain